LKLIPVVSYFCRSGVSEEELNEVRSLLTSISNLEELQKDLPKGMKKLYSKTNRSKAEKIRDEALLELENWNDDSDENRSENEVPLPASATKSSPPTTKSSQPTTKSSQPSTKSSQPTTKSSQPPNKGTEKTEESPGPPAAKKRRFGPLGQTDFISYLSSKNEAGFCNLPRSIQLFMKGQFIKYFNLTLSEGK
jgi:hypothetical protein